MASFGMLIVVVAMAASAHLLLRAGMAQVGRIGADELQTPAQLIHSLLATPQILLAMPLYGGSFVAWAIVLSRVQLSLAYPALAMMYFVIPLASWVFLNESVTPLHWVGIAVIVAGVMTVLAAGWN